MVSASAFDVLAEELGAVAGRIERETKLRIDAAIADIARALADSLAAAKLLPIVVEWTDRVHHAGAIVTFDGSTYQAIEDTSRAPPHDGWTCIARAGRDGSSFSIESTFEPDRSYRALSVVALNGASFVARRDDPGPCPGDGWQLIAAQGKRGHPGNPGRVIGLVLDDAGVVTLTNSDGTTVVLDLYPLLAKVSAARAAAA